MKSILPAIVHIFFLVYICNSVAAQTQRGCYQGFIQIAMAHLDSFQFDRAITNLNAAARCDDKPVIDSTQYWKDQTEVLRRQYLADLQIKEKQVQFQDEVNELRSIGISLLQAKQYLEAKNYFEQAKNRIIDAEENPSKALLSELELNIQLCQSLQIQQTRLDSIQRVYQQLLHQGDSIRSFGPDFFLHSFKFFHQASQMAETYSFLGSAADLKLFELRQQLEKCKTPKCILNSIEHPNLTLGTRLHAREILMRNSLLLAEMDFLQSDTSGGLDRIQDALKRNANYYPTTFSYTKNLVLHFDRYYQKREKWELYASFTTEFVRKNFDFDLNINFPNPLTEQQASELSYFIEGGFRVVTNSGEILNSDNFDPQARERTQAALLNINTISLSGNPSDRFTKIGGEFGINYQLNKRVLVGLGIGYIQNYDYYISPNTRAERTCYKKLCLTFYSHDFSILRLPINVYYNLYNKELKQDNRRKRDFNLSLFLGTSVDFHLAPSLSLMDWISVENGIKLLKFNYRNAKTNRDPISFHGSYGFQLRQRLFRLHYVFFEFRHSFMIKPITFLNLEANNFFDTTTSNGAETFDFDLFDNQFYDLNELKDQLSYKEKGTFNRVYLSLGMVFPLRQRVKN